MCAPGCVPRRAKLTQHGNRPEEVVKEEVWGFLLTPHSGSPFRFRVPAGNTATSTWHLSTQPSDQLFC